MKILLLFTQLFFIIQYNVLPGQNSTEILCQHKFNNNPFTINNSCELSISNEDFVELRVVGIGNKNIQQRWVGPDSVFHLTSIIVNPDPDYRYGTYIVNYFSKDEWQESNFKVLKKITNSENKQSLLRNNKNNRKKNGETLPNQHELPKSGNNKDKRSKKANCKNLLGYWWGMDSKYNMHFDFNVTQLIIRENYSAAYQIPRYIFNYKLVDDRLILKNELGDNITLKVTRREDCDIILLRDINRTGLICNESIILNKTEGWHCDCPEDYIMKRKHVIPTPIDDCNSGSIPDIFSKNKYSFNQKRAESLLILYSILFLVLSFFTYTKKAKISPALFHLIMCILCFILHYFETPFFYFFVVHLLLFFKNILQRIKLINSIGRLFLFASFAAIVTIFEFVFIFQYEIHVTQWLSIIPLLSLIVAFPLIIEFIKDGRIYSRFSTIQLLFGAILLYGIMYSIVISQKGELIEFGQTKISQFYKNKGPTLIKCPE